MSELTHPFVNDPTELGKPGDRVQVKVVSVDAARKRIGLSFTALEVRLTLRGFKAQRLDTL